MSFYPANLTSLADKYGSDKGSVVHHAHRYAGLYSFIFSSFYMQHFNMLEIGLKIGPENQTEAAGRISMDAPSVSMWLDFFPNAHIFGIDISDFTNFAPEDRFTFIRCDAGSTEALGRLKMETPTFKIVIDDGSHCPFHQQVAFSELFEKISSGGFYVIEDLHWVNYDADKILPEAPRTEEIFKNFIETGILESPHIKSEVKHDIGSKIANIFVHWDDRGGTDTWKIKMIAIQKR